jgi:hypothetical protein
MTSCDPNGKADLQFLLLDLDSALLLMDVAERVGDGQTAIINYENAHWTYDIIFWKMRSIRSTDQKLNEVEEKLALLRSRLEAIGHEF